jgi:hypothetical protein
MTADLRWAADDRRLPASKSTNLGANSRASEPGAATPSAGVSGEPAAIDNRQFPGLWYHSNCRRVDQPQGHMSDFGRCATDTREPRQVRKEATVASLSVCRSIPKSGAQHAKFGVVQFGVPPFGIRSSHWEVRSQFEFRVRSLRFGKPAPEFDSCANSGHRIPKNPNRKSPIAQRGNSELRTEELRTEQLRTGETCTRSSPVNTARRRSTTS